MPTEIEARLRELEAECVALCHEHQWLNEAGAPNYQFLYSHPVTFRPRADLMLMAVHPHGGVVNLPDLKPGYTALLDEAWGESDAGARQVQALAMAIAGLITADPEQALRKVPAANMIPFRTESISRLPDPLRKQGLVIGGSLVGMVKPRILVLMGGDRVLFQMAVSQLPGRRLEATEVTFGATRRAYRDLVVADDEASTFAAVVPLHAIEEGLATLRRRLEEKQLIPPRS